MDFTMKTYQELMKALKYQGFSFSTFAAFMLKPVEGKVIILRHDVDLLPQNSLQTAWIEKELDIKGTHYFRIVMDSFDINIIKEISILGHEIGYHYETIDMVNEKLRMKNEKLKTETIGSFYEKLIDEAYRLFCENLEKFREIVPVKTICMHGSPRSHFDNKDIWKKYSYRDLGIIGEPYFDIDFNEVLYLTDTGRCWDGWKYSVRDKMPQQEEWIKKGLVFHSTNDIIKAAEEGKLPDKIMITFHPQRWTDKPLPWVRELVLQNVKNIAKYGMMRMRKRD
jgi:hypothetical protein